MKTRTGSFPIGFCRLKSDWQKDLGSVIAWSKENGLEVIDLVEGGEGVRTLIDADMKVGSINLPDNKGMISADKAKRDEAVARNAEHIRACGAYGPMNHFVVMLPENPELAPAENFAYMVESFGELVALMEEKEARLVIEGWPGAGDICCTPEGYRALFKELDSNVMGVNYDPSHLIRMNIDHLRFLREFVGRVYHAHGKDTEILEENLYEYGSENPSIFAESIPFGSTHWRYTIPGHGRARWIEILRLLESGGYSGCISIELEDANFNSGEKAEKLGIIQGARFLEGC